MSAPKAWPWLTERRAWALVIVLSVIGIALGYSDFNHRAEAFDRPLTFGRK